MGGLEWKVLGAWLLTNLVLPFVIPVLFLYLCGFIVDNRDLWSPGGVLRMLFQDGIFVFLGLTFLLSVFQDYVDAKFLFTWWVWLILIVNLLLTGFMFISSLNIVSDGRVFAENLKMHYWTLSFSIAIAVWLKVRTILMLKKIKYYGIR